MNDFDILNREEIYDGAIIKVVRDTIKLPNGNEAKRELVIHNGASVIVPIDDHGKILFVRQYRHAARKYMLELPAGSLDEGEDALTCAVRELEEETGFKAGRFTFVMSLYSAVGFSNEVLNVYMAEGLFEGVQNPDDDEFINIEKYSFDEAIDQIFDGSIRDSKTVSGVLAVKELLKNRTV